MSEQEVEKTPEQTTADGEEPSMEEILASIRRIISDDDQEEGEASVAENEAETEKTTEAVEEAKADDILELTDAVTETPADDVLELADLAEEPQAEILTTETAAPQTNGPELISENTQEASVSSLNSLYSIASKAAHPVGNADKTLEDIVKECLKPLLKDWLDAQLPPMVEKIVATEIERLIRRAG